MKRIFLVYSLAIFFGFLGCEKETEGVIPVNHYSKPFARNSVWNREIPSNTVYYDVNGAIWGDTAQAPNRVDAELVTLCFVDKSQPEVEFYKSEGWYYPERSIKSGSVIYKRRLAYNSGTEIRYPNTANGSFVIINPETGIADEGSGGWREPGEWFTSFYDEPRLHNIDLNGNGQTGTLGSGLPALGGLLRLGELNSTITHALALSISSRRFSKDVYYVSPASQGDGFASNPSYGYLGDNPKYTIGTLLAIPYSIDIDSVTWNTPQGYNLAIANQKYGWYIVDSSTGEVGGDIMKLNIDRVAAYEDMGLSIDKTTNEITVDSSKIDFAGFENDVKTIMQMVMATTK